MRYWLHLSNISRVMRTLCITCLGIYLHLKFLLNSSSFSKIAHAIPTSVEFDTYFVDCVS